MSIFNNLRQVYVKTENTSMSHKQDIYRINPANRKQLAMSTYVNFQQVLKENLTINLDPEKLMYLFIYLLFIYLFINSPGLFVYRDGFYQQLANYYESPFSFRFV